MNNPNRESIDTLPHPLAARSDRRRFINVFIVVALGAIAASNWPTEARKVEKRARAFHEALSRGDSIAAAAMMSPRARGALIPARAAAVDVVDVQVAKDGLSAVVTIADPKTGVRSATPWVRIDSAWYRD